MMPDAVFMGLAMMGATIAAAFGWALIEYVYEVIRDKLDHRYAARVQSDRNKFNRF
jgi:hypothetical protein